MEVLTEIISIFYDGVLRGIFISVLLIAFVRKFIKKVDTQYALSIIRWLLIIYSSVALLRFLLATILFNDSNDSVFISRATGPYWYAYWLMIIAPFTPLLLFFKKLQDKIYFILFLAFLINIGWLFETVVIQITSMHRDYLTENPPDAVSFSTLYELILIEGLLVGLLALIAGNIIYQSKNREKPAAVQNLNAPGNDA